MNVTEKIAAVHLQRQAVVYLRQSSPKQVLQHRESAANQRALTERLRAFGWPSRQIVVIDEDQGLSGAQAVGRGGFQRLVADVGLRKVGIIMGYEVSRLSRNCADWHQLLELCGVFDTLIGDADGVYHPRDFNDRLLLGLKGTMSAAELHSLRLRLDAGRLSKAKRGELRQHLPTGYVRAPDGTAVFDPDVSVQDRLRLIFQKFLELGTIQKVVTDCRQQGLKIPRRQTSGLFAGAVLWKEPSSSALASILKNPAYAGAFAHGRRIVDPARQQAGRPATGRIRRPRSEWIALVHGVYAAYLSFEQYERIQNQIAENAQKMQERCARRRAIRGGAALLAGLVRCGRCGRSMRVHYRSDVEGKYQYGCNSGYQRYGEPSCQAIAGRAVDEAVIREFFSVLQPAQIDAWQAVCRREIERQGELIRHLGQDVQRLSYEATRAERQYDAVDPENRLIAATLENKWESALADLQEAEGRLAEARQAPFETPSISAEQRQAFADVGRQLPSLWPTLSSGAQKSLLRTLVTTVNLRRGDEGTLQVRIGWRGGLVTETVLRVRSLTLHGSDAERKLVERIRQLSEEGLKDAEIADRLNQEGFLPCRADGFTPQVVIKTRRRFQIMTTRHQAKGGGLPCGYSVGEMAEFLQIDPSWIYRHIAEGNIKIARHRRFGCYLFPKTQCMLRQMQQFRQKEISHVSVPEVH